MKSLRRAPGTFAAALIPRVAAPLSRSIRWSFKPPPTATSATISPLPTSTQTVPRYILVRS